LSWNVGIVVLHTLMLMWRNKDNHCFANNFTRLKR